MPNPEDLNEEERALLGYADKTEEEIAEEDALKLRAQHTRELLQYLMQGDLFREWLMGLINSFGAFGNPFGASPTGFPDPLATQFALGRKSAGWELWELIDNLDPIHASLMRREAGDRADLAERRSRR